VDAFYVHDGAPERPPSRTEFAPLEFTLPRDDGCTLALVKAQVPRAWHSPNAAMQALVRAVTCWVQETPDGQALWAASSQDLNIGDLHAHGITPALRVHLAREGILELHVALYELSGPCAYGFDSVLVQE
jgi:hypothetical protein